VIGALIISLALSLIATPVCYLLLYRLIHLGRSDESSHLPIDEIKGVDM
jgi:hypothetical protein